MRFLVSTAAIVVGLAGLVFGSPAANKAADDGPVWTVQVFPNEEARVFTGDALDVYAQVKALNPNFGADDNSTVQDETNRALSERSTIRPPDCWDTFLYGTHYLRINEASQAMKNLNAPVGVAARSCVRLACIPGPNAGFALCNDEWDTDHVRTKLNVHSTTLLEIVYESFHYQAPAICLRDVIFNLYISGLVYEARIGDEEPEQSENDDGAVT
ncbi:hypothetical protein DL96DRAFT_1562811 [Flagelloscypha sp. PMI_526]|nr:hypothetical protein DL96DRAFT_1562811 [Flagelloscypha sp. PMI_526]